VRKVRKKLKSESAQSSIERHGRENFSPDRGMDNIAEDARPGAVPTNRSKSPQALGAKKGLISKYPRREKKGQSQQTVRAAQQDPVTDGF